MESKIFFQVIVIFLCISFVSCKKGEIENDDIESENVKRIAEIVDDQFFVFTELIPLTMDAYKALDTIAFYTGSPGIEISGGQVCGGTISWNTQSNPMIGTISYNGENCDGSRQRSGSISVSLAKNNVWHSGVPAKIIFNNLKITRSRDSKSITLSGEQLYHGAGSIPLSELPSYQIPLHLLGGNALNVVFENGTQCNYKIETNLTFTYDNGIVIQVLNAGILNTNISNIESIGMSGSNRFGGTFATDLGGAIFREDCNYRLTSGIPRYVIDSTYAGFVDAGRDAAGTPAVCPVNFFYVLNAYDTASESHEKIISPY